MSENCIFCKIINGSIPSYKIYEDNEFIVILDKFPSSVGHTLVITKSHAENIFELDENTGERLFALAIKVSKAVKQALKCDGLNILQNNGEAAGQTVNHFHMHIIPRYENDDVNIGWKTKQADDLTFDSIFSSIKAHLDKK